MLWDGEKLGGYVGMCGWLPFAGDVKAVFNNEKGTDGDGDGDGDGEEGFDPFEREDGEGDGEEAVNVDIAARVVRVMREMLEMDGEGPTCCPRSFDIPVFLGHGDEDEKVPISRGREAAECLEAAGFDASWREYQGLGHWYSAEMLADMVGFLKSNTGWENGIKTS
jgi:pimeloyl-ACP methyl ester carboxylesterase